MCPPMPKTPESVSDLPFEKALEELEAIVAKMEDGKLPLEESLAAYQRGAQLLRQCEGKLSAAQARISVLEGEILKDLPAAES